MHFSSLQEFLAMGGHGVYVWTCYMVASVIIFTLFWQPYARKKAFIRQQKQQLRRDARQTEAN